MSHVVRLTFNFIGDNMSEDTQSIQEPDVTLTGEAPKSADEMTLEMWRQLDKDAQEVVLVNFFQSIAKLSKFASETVVRVQTLDAIVAQEFPKYTVKSEAKECCGGQECSENTDGAAA